MITETPPRLYDLTTLQREANRLFGYTAKQTLDYTQSLYEKKLCTYPRTDSQYLTDDMLPTAETIVSGLFGTLDFAKDARLSSTAARVAGVPKPLRSASSEMSPLPARSIADNRVSSV